MMVGAQEIIGGLLVVVGAFFYLVGAIGIYRMPDVYTRMHAASVSETLGVGFLVLGMVVLAGFTLISVKLGIILGIVLCTGPIATHALAQAALHEGIKPAGVGNEILVGPGAHDEPVRIGSKRAKQVQAANKRQSAKRKTSRSRKTSSRTANSSSKGRRSSKRS